MTGVNAEELEHNKGTTCKKVGSLKGAADTRYRGGDKSERSEPPPSVPSSREPPPGVRKTNQKGSLRRRVAAVREVRRGGAKKRVPGGGV